MYAMDDVNQVILNICDEILIFSCLLSWVMVTLAYLIGLVPQLTPLNVKAVGTDV
jgi:hypothetical protein